MDIIFLLLGTICVVLGMLLIPFHKKVKAEKAHAFALLILGVLIIVVPFVLGLSSVSELVIPIIAMLIMILISAVVLAICHSGFGNKKKYMDFYAKCKEHFIIYPFSESQKQELLLIAKNYGLKDEKSASKAYEKGESLTDANIRKESKKFNKKYEKYKKESEQAKEKQYKEEHNRYLEEKKLTKRRGKEKYLHTLNAKLDYAKLMVSELKHKKDNLPYVSTKGTDWAVAGGVASAIGGTVAGVAVALDTQLRNEKHKKTAEDWNKMVTANKGTIQAMHDAELLENEMKVEEYQREIDLIKKKLIDDNEQQNKMKLLKFDITGALTESGLLALDVIPKQVGKVEVLNSPAVLDGSVRILVQNTQNETIGEAYYNAPDFHKYSMDKVGFGVSEKRQVIAVPLKGKTFTSDKDLSYKVEPVYLWAIEKN